MSFTHPLPIDLVSLPPPTFLPLGARSVFLLLFDFLFFTSRLRGNLSAGAIPVADGLIESRTSPQTQKGFHGPTSLRCRIILRDTPCCLSLLNIDSIFHRDLFHVLFVYLCVLTYLNIARCEHDVYFKSITYSVPVIVYDFFCFVFFLFLVFSRNASTRNALN